MGLVKVYAFDFEAAAALLRNGFELTRDPIRRPRHRPACPGGRSVSRLESVLRVPKLTQLLKSSDEHAPRSPGPAQPQLPDLPEQQSLERVKQVIRLCLEENERAMTAHRQ